MLALVLAACGMLFEYCRMCRLIVECAPIDFLFPSSLMLALVLAACGMLIEGRGMYRMLVGCAPFDFLSPPR